jgi:hypothetical protein
LIGEGGGGEEEHVVVRVLDLKGFVEGRRRVSC